MKKFSILLISISILVSCQNQEKRYTTSSLEIDNAKSSIKAYEDGNWELWASKYAEGAEIYHNNWDKSKTSAEAVQGHISMLKNFSEYGYVDNPIFFEMIIDDEGEKWVNYWAIWEGTSINGKKLKIPIHMSRNYKDGKVVKEYGFWDTYKLMLILEENIENEVVEIVEEIE